MRTTLDCFPCLVEQTVRVARLCTDETSVRERILRRVLGILSEVDPALTPPEATTPIYDVARELTGVADPYEEIKRRTNALALSLLPRLEARVRDASDPLEVAMRLALAGNIIDFGACADRIPGDMIAEVDHCLAAPVEGMDVERIRKAVGSAGSILFVGDNAGEIVFDRPLLEVLGPDRVTYVVRGGPCINDATLADARQAGLTELVRVMDTGSSVPGAPPARCSAGFRQALDGADLVICKGQGNYETLGEVDLRILFLLRAKCHVVARDLGVSEGGLVARGRDL